jgi:nucleoside-diphosphate-sugar epimerase
MFRLSDSLSSSQSLDICLSLTKSIKMVNIFITGATGYIGGDTLYELYNKHPEYSYTALVRTAEKGKSVTDKFPKVKTVQGDNDSSDLLKKEASKADIVIREFLLFWLDYSRIPTR